MKKAKDIIFTFLIVYLCIVGALYIIQRSLIYFPDGQRPDIQPFEQFDLFEVGVENAEGMRLTGWMKKPDEGKPILVVFHGNASIHPASFLYIARPYTEKGYGFLSVGYRGYNGNEGKPSEKGFYVDARAWIENLLQTGAKQNDIILYGQSIGTGAAVQMATEFPDIKVLILESPYTSLPDVAASKYFFVPVHLLMKDRFNNLQKINDVKVPLVVIQGMSDRIIPPRYGQKLFDQANEPKHLLQFKGHGHNDLPVDEMAQKTMKILEKN